jgi:hypothetical protein
MTNLEILRIIGPRVVFAVLPVLAVGALLEGYLQRRAARRHDVDAPAISSEEQSPNGGDR